MSDEELANETPEQRKERYRSISFGAISNGKPAHLKRVQYRPPTQPDQTPIMSERPGGFKTPILQADGTVLTKHVYNQDKAKFAPLVERSQKAVT